MRKAVYRYRLETKHYDEVTKLLGHAVLKIKSQVPFRGSLNYLECETADEDIAAELEMLGGERQI